MSMSATKHVSIGHRVSSLMVHTIYKRSVSSRRGFSGADAPVFTRYTDKKRRVGLAARRGRSTSVVQTVSASSLFPGMGFLFPKHEAQSTTRQVIAEAGGSKKTFSTFDELVRQSDLVLVDFYATWCGPCQLMSQVMSELSPRMPDISFVKINTEKYPSIASKFQVNALPTLVLFKNGKPVRRFEGALTASQLQQWLMEAFRS